jgi:uncharacterized protein (TIGR02265 family)
MSDVRGLIIQSRLDHIENLGDGNAYAQIMQKLAEPVRQAIGEQVFLTNLYPFHLLKDLDMVIGESLNEPLESIFKHIGEKYAELILDRYFYNYIVSKDPQKFLGQLGNLYQYLWNFGKYSYHKINDKSAKIIFEYDEDIHKPYCWFMQSLIRRGVEICGGGSVNLIETECEADDGEACQYQLAWK